MQRRTHHAVLALALLAGCTRAHDSTSTPEDAGPPPTFLEAEPDNVATPNRVSIVFDEGLGITLLVSPLSLAAGKHGFELELEFHNLLPSKVEFDLGPEPLVRLSVLVRQPDGSGFGSGGSCGFGSNSFGHKEQMLGPGEHRSWQLQWTGGVEAQQVLEADIFLCGVRLPNGDRLSGELARLEAAVDEAGRLAKFELRASPRQR